MFISTILLTVLNARLVEHRRSLETSVTRKKSPNVYKSCPKMISQEK